jgi:acetoin utilization protein AcuB
MQIVNLMTPDPVTIDQHDRLSKAKSIMTAGNFRRVPVVDDGRLVGILTERDLQKYSGFLESTRVNAAMRTSLITVTPYDAVEDTALLMLKHKIGGLPVVAEGKLVGIVTTSDLSESASERRQGNRRDNAGMSPGARSDQPTLTGGRVRRQNRLAALR